MTTSQGRNLWVALLAGLWGFMAVGAENQWRIAQRGPHERVWERPSQRSTPDGRVFWRTNRYVELATGLHYWEGGQWKDAREEIEILEGSAVARQGQHQVIFAANLNTAGAIDLLAPDGKRFRSHLLGLAYTDAATGQSVLIAQVRDCNGAVLPPNQVFYLDAFVGDCRADVRYTYSLSGFEQDIILLTAPPSPAEWGLAPETTRLEVWTEFLEAPEPIIEPIVLRFETDPLKRQTMVEPDLIDEHLDFGVMKIGSGAAFPLGEEGLFGEGSVPTGKSWTQAEGRRFLIEKVEYGAILPSLQMLPQAAAVDKGRDRGLPRPARGVWVRHFPAQPVGVRGIWRPNQLAKVEPPRGGLVLDYITLNGSQTDYVFKGDTTYFITNSISLYGTTVLEGGAVIKYETNSLAKLRLLGPLDCRTGPWHPAIFTARDDDSVGEVLNSSDSVIDGRYGVAALQFGYSSESFEIHDIRIRHVYNAFQLEYNNAVHLAHAQLSHGNYAVYGLGNNTFRHRNVLFCDYTNHAFYGGITSRGEQATFHKINKLSYSPNNVTALTNSLLICVTNDVYWTGDSANVKTNLDDTGIFETVGAGAHYLADDTYRDLGTDGIDADLLEQLKKRTTGAPVVVTTNITGHTWLVPVVQRDTNTLDLGYHYDPMDVVLHGVIVTNAALTLERGLALGTYGASNEYGLLLESGSSLTAQGSATNPVRIFRYSLVQEQANTNWSSSSAGSSVRTPAWEVAAHPTASFRFTEWSLPASQGNHLFGGFEDIPVISFVDGQFHGGQVYSDYPGMAFTNCLLNRVNVDLGAVSGDFYNNTVYGGAVSVDALFGTYHLHNNLFDTSNLVQSADVTASYNAYVTNQNRWTPTNSSDVILLSTSYEPGPLGRFYLPTNSPLINQGSDLASAFGLYHFTTDATNQVKETNSTVDLGFHYVATDSNGTPLDADSDGVPDYEEDADANGSQGLEERNWQQFDTDSDYDGRSDKQEDEEDGTRKYDPTSVKSVRLGYWRFNDTNNFAGEAGQQPTIKQSLSGPSSWSTNSVYVDSDGALRYREIDTDGTANINCRNGTIRVWFKPHWASTNLGGYGPENYARLIELGAWSSTGLKSWWVLGLDPPGANLSFVVHSNGVAVTYVSTPISWTNGLWQQLVLTYSPTNVALYTNGELAAVTRSSSSRPSLAGTTTTLNNVGGGVSFYPPAQVRIWGFRVGNAYGNQQQANGEFEELETFNYPLTAQEVARDFPNFNGASDLTLDTDYDGRSDLLEREVDGTGTNDISSVAGSRLGYWRFHDNPTNRWLVLGEQGQVPTLTNSLDLAPGWSSNALVIQSASASSLVYQDVETTGWANVNCRNGAARFWFKPNWGGSPPDAGQLLFVGNSGDPSQGKWSLEVVNSGSTLQFTTATNASVVTNCAASVAFTEGKWHQIVLNYTPTNSTLYLNGSLLTTNLGVSYWPALAERTNGLVIGNRTGAGQPINGQFDELETFNRPLTSSEIGRSFEVVRATDLDLNGVADLLEDMALTNPVPFLGRPFVVTGTIEAEQFDMGGKGVAYTNVANNRCTNDYRASGMEITNCNDKGGGYCVDKLKAGDWLHYTIDVRVGQTYAVEARAAGIGTNGTFRIDFYTNNVPYTNTPDLTLTTTNWTNITYKMLGLAAGTNAMRLVMVSDSDEDSVGRFNYLSIYPAWEEAVTNLSDTNEVTLLDTNQTWVAASNNAARIQMELDNLTTNGVVLIPAGNWLVAQATTDENLDAHQNTAVFVSKSNVEIRGEGKTNTVLIGFNRATTLFYLGRAGSDEPAAVTNVWLRDLSLVGRPHWVSVTNTDAGSGENFTNYWETGALNVTTNHSGVIYNLGSLLLCYGLADPIRRNENIVITNCVFQNASFDGIVMGTVTNCLVSDCDFLFRADGTNGLYSGVVTNSANTNTAPYPSGGVGYWVRAAVVFNCVFVKNTFDGNPSLTSVNTNYFVDAGDGIFWNQSGGNVWVAQNAISNYCREAIQLNGGPAAATRNDFYTYASLYAVCALNGQAGPWTTPTGSSQDHVYSFVGNVVDGGRHAELGFCASGNSVPYALHVCGNLVNLHQVFNRSDDYPGAVVTGRWVEFLNASGNTLLQGGHGVRWLELCTNAVVLKNDFGGSSYRALAYDGDPGAAQNISILKNVLNQGVSYHIKLPEPDSFSFFLQRNSYTNATGNGSAVLDPAGSPVHFTY